MDFQSIIQTIDKAPYYQDDAVVIYHADCRDILPLIPDKSIDLVLTDPPYGINFRDNEWDKGIPDWIDMSRRVSGKVIFTTAPLTLWDYPQPDWVICWYRPAASSRSLLGGLNHWTPILVYGKPKFGVDVKQIHNMEDNHVRKYIDHPTPKPTRLLDWLINNASEIDNLILDPFLGSGTTAYCAKKLGRKCIGIEIEEKYCEIAAKRCSQEVFDLKI